MPLTATFERPADPSLLERLEEMDAGKAEKVEDRKAAPPATSADTEKAGNQAEAEAEAKIIDVVNAIGEAREENYEADLMEGVGLSEGGEVADDTFDPESPEGAEFEDFQTGETVVGNYQLLQHVDSPEHEDPDEASFLLT